MSIYPPPELMSKADRELMAEDLGYPRDHFEKNLNMDKVFVSGGKRISMKEWKKEWDAAE